MAVVAGRSTGSLGSILVTLHELGVAAAGFMGGFVVFGGVLRWIGTSYELYQLHRTWRMVIASSFFHSGFWLLIVTGMFAYYTRSMPMAAWLFGGFVVAVLFNAVLAAVALAKWRHNRKKRAQNAA